MSVAEELTFHLEDFDGPLELLLALVAKHKMDLHNIPILELIDQYTATVARALGAGATDKVVSAGLDGTVLAAGDAVARDYGEGSSAADDLEIAYAAIDARDLSEDELRAVADCSFVFEDDANAAFERALERKSGEADHEA